MTDQSIPLSKAREFAVACHSDDPDAFYRPFEFTRDDLPFLDEGEYVLVEFRRRRRKPADYVVVLDEEHVEAVTV